MLAPLVLRERPAAIAPPLKRGRKLNESPLELSVAQLLQYYQGDVEATLKTHKDGTKLRFEFMCVTEKGIPLEV